MPMCAASLLCGKLLPQLMEFNVTSLEDDVDGTFIEASPTPGNDIQLHGLQTKEHMVTLQNACEVVKDCNGGISPGSRLSDFFDRTRSLLIKLRPQVFI
ncbi:hypothetical protein GOP47_0018551 [Adiantum capillus-veneris]|uniref:Uncharacterized protein n=1 Tax=Adiantum capillus-veneris TaxID=13818 RepID=A0A9D4UDW5_ADICA|nr:hypothetical protein GOP47_0018551 [Adiantum capillus-veneris]